MENHEYAAILDAMPKTGVYVIRESDHALLYLNKRAREASPGVRLGVPCPGREAGSCGVCLLPSMDDGERAWSVSYDPHYGGVADVTAARVEWENADSAYVITVAPRQDPHGYTYRKILHADLDQDRCSVMKSEPGGWRPGKGLLSEYFRDFVQSGAVYSEDVKRFEEFTQLEHLRAAVRSGQDVTSLIYRREAEGAYRWNIMEVLPCQDGGRYAVICVKDVHDVLREGLEREEMAVRSQELIRSLGEQNLYIYTINLNTGDANPIRVDGEMRERLETVPWDGVIRERIREQLHEAYQDQFVSRFSLAGLRRARASGQPKSELLCQRRSGNAYRYFSVTAYFGGAPEAASYTVLAIQDVDQRMRRELAHTERDMQMAAILKSRYQMMNTVHLDTGLCERVNLNQADEPENTLIGDYSAYIERALTHYVRPEDAEGFRAALSLEHLRERAETVEDWCEEICQYRPRSGEERWIELHVLYTRQKDQVVVNIMGQDVTREKRQEEERLRALEDRAYMITGLSTLFFSTYYIDLERDAFRAVTQLRRVSDLLGDEVNFTNALRLYASQFIHPDDREKYLEIMDIQNLRRSLRWWQPYVTADYRKLPDFPGQGEEECQWVRCTALLARVGADDLPRTAVYVARNISEEECVDRSGT